MMMLITIFVREGVERRRFLVGSGRPSMLMLVRSAAALTPFGGLAADADAVMM